MKFLLGRAKQGISRLPRRRDNTDGHDLHGNALDGGRAFPWDWHVGQWHEGAGRSPKCIRKLRVHPLSRDESAPPPSPADSSSVAAHGGTVAAARDAGEDQAQRAEAARGNREQH